MSLLQDGKRLLAVGEYTGYDVATRKSEEMIKISQLGVPVIVIGGDVMVGFDRQKSLTSRARG